MALDLSNAAWRKARGSAQGQDCVELAPVDGVVAVRDSKDPDGPVLAFSPEVWRRFTRGLRNL